MVLFILLHLQGHSNCLRIKSLSWTIQINDSNCKAAIYVLISYSTAFSQTDIWDFFQLQTAGY